MLRRGNRRNLTGHDDELPSLKPPNAPPEPARLDVLREDKDVAFAQSASPHAGKRALDELSADALAAPIRRHREMVEVAAPAILTSQQGAHQTADQSAGRAIGRTLIRPTVRQGDEAQPGVLPEKGRDVFPGIRLAQADPRGRLPQRADLLVVFDAHLADDEAGSEHGYCVVAEHGLGQGEAARLTPASDRAHGQAGCVCPATARVTLGTAPAILSEATMMARSILVVDDEANMLTTMQFILESAGYRVACAGSAAEALAILEEQLGRGAPPDLVIADVQMPGMRGPELAAEVALRGCRAPVLLITGYSNREMLESLRRSGRGEILEKPFEEEDLLARVRNLLRVSRPGS